MQRLIKIIEKKLNVRITNINFSFNDLGSDELDFIEIVMEAEKEYNIVITDYEIEEETEMTVLELAKVIQKYCPIKFLRKEKLKRILKYI